MKQQTVEQFKGLQVQQNSFTVKPGYFERIDNAVLVQDFIVSKKRGENLHHQFQSNQIINSFFDYGTSTFAVSQNILYRLIRAATPAQVQSFSGSNIISVRKTGHGIRNNDYIADFLLVNTDPFVSAFPRRQGDTYGVRQVFTQFTLTAVRNANVVTVTFNNHGLTTGNTVSVSGSTLVPPVATGTKTVTVVNANTFTFPDVAANSAGSVTLTLLDTFRITADANATASVVSGALAASYRYYWVQPGQAISVTPGGVRKSRTVKSNKNAYFTTDNGILKLEREDLPVIKSGIPPGLDLQGYLGKSSGVMAANTGPIAANSQVSYRVLFGRRDANNNLVLGAPSQFLTLRNVRIAVAPANVAFAAGVITVTSTAHGLNNGEFVYLYDVVATGGTIPDGTAFPVSGAAANTFQINLTTAGFTTITNVTSLSYGVKKTAYLTFTIPSEILSTEYIYRIYRSSQSASDVTTPFPDFKLVQEANLTPAQIAQGFVDFIDEVDDALISTNAELYTNPTQEGEQQANARPPRATDVALFKDHIFYADIVQYRNLSFSVVAPNNLANGSYIDIGTQRYLFRGNADNEPVGNERRTDVATRTANVVDITHTNHGFAAGDTVYIVSSTLTPPIPPGLKTITAVAANFFQFADVNANSAGTAEYEGVASSTGARLVKRVVPDSAPLVTLSEAIFLTTSYLVKAINRNPNSTVYAQYASGVSDAPGKVFLIAKDINAVTFAMVADTSTTGLAFVPTLPTSGTGVSDTQDVSPNDLYIAKQGEPEAVPLLNSLPAGSRSSRILRIAPLRDSLIILKQDGVFRLNGDSVSNFTITALDTTVICKSADSVVVLNNSVYAFTNQGFVQITDTAVQIVSRDIEPFLSSILGIDRVPLITSAVGYESERLYIVSTLRPNSNSAIADICYVYNYLTNAWTTWSEETSIYSAGYVSDFDDKLYGVRADAQYLMDKERKNQNKIDYTGQEYCMPIILGIVASASSTLGSANVTVSTLYEHNLKVGDLLTVSRTSTTLAAGFAGGASDVNGLRLVTSVINKNIFTFAAATAATTATTGNLYFEKGISEFALIVSVTAGLKLATFTTPVVHGLTTGQPIKIYALSAAISAALGSPNDLLGTRSINVTSPTTFTVQLSANATGTATDTVSILDKRQQAKYVTIQTTTGFKLNVGDAIIVENTIYKIFSFKQFNTSTIIAELLIDYSSLSTEVAFVHSGYKLSLRFTPMTGGNVAMLKYYTEFQAAFRNYASCSQLSIGFAADSFNSTVPTMWDVRVGTDRIATNYIGWGDFEWGDFPWGGIESIDREYITRPAVIMRTYMPLEAVASTFIQPLMEHYTAGEPFELQSIAYYMQPSSNRTTR